MTMTQYRNTMNETPTVKKMTIEPDLAIHWLETANTNNRKVSDAHVQKLARDMADGKWRLTHEGIAFAPNGTLLDGQHRLWAVVESNTPVQMHVWNNMDDQSMMFVDCGKPRSTRDVLNIAGDNGEVSQMQLAALRAMLAGFGLAPAMTPSQTSEMLKVHESAMDFALANLPNVRSAKGINKADTRGVIARAWYSVDKANLKDFCRKLTTGVVTSENESVIVLLRQQLQANAGVSYKERLQRYGKIERVLRAFLKGENPSRLYAVSTEQFPLPGE